MNKVILVGNLGRDPEVRAFPNGGRVCNLRIATSETWRDMASGERRERTEWHSVAIFNENLVGVAERFLKKGSKVYIEGQLENRKAPDQNGGERYFTEVVLRPYRGELTLLDSRGAAAVAMEPARTMAAAPISAPLPPWSACPAQAADLVVVAGGGRGGAAVRAVGAPTTTWTTRSRSTTAGPRPIAARKPDPRQANGKGETSASRLFLLPTAR